MPMNRTVKAALLEAKAGALSDFVIEWAGKKVASVKKGLRATAKRAGVGHVSPHMLRHSAAVHMAEAAIPMEEIAQFLGHDDVETTRRVYARFSPTYLAKAASALEYDDLAALPSRLARREWWAREGSNFRPLLCQSSALPLSYAPTRFNEPRTFLQRSKAATKFLADSFHVKEVLFR